MHFKRFESAEALVQAAADLLLEHFQAEYDLPHAVMLSGGKTPLGVYSQIIQSRIKASASLNVLFSDERMVPPDSAESNYGNASSMIQALGLPAARVMRVHTRHSLNQAANDYDKQLREFLAHGGKIPLGLLGLGLDGHTASLFSFADIERGLGRYAVGVPRHQGHDRVSVTPDLLNRIGKVVFLVSGKEKAKVVEQLRQSPRKLVAGRAVANAASVEVWVA